MSGYLAQFFLFFLNKKELWKTLVSEMAIFCISDLVRNLKNLLIELKCRKADLSRQSMFASVLADRIIPVKILIIKPVVVVEVGGEGTGFQRSGICIIGINYKLGTEKWQSLQNRICRCLV